MDQLRPQGAPHERLITLVIDCPGHDRRYLIDRIELVWQPRQTFEQGLVFIVRRFLSNLGWCRAMLQLSGQPRS